MRLVGRVSGEGRSPMAMAISSHALRRAQLRAVLCYFVAKDVAVGDAEVEVFEEVGDAGEEADALDAAGFGLIEEGADEEAAGSLALGFRADDDGADLGQVLAVDVECRAADELAGCRFDDGEGVDVGANFRRERWRRVPS